jgi:hypothetical protein
VPRSRASGWSLLTTLWGFPCCVRFPCVHAVATTPAQRLGVLFALLHPTVSAFPERVVGSACALSFSSIAQRSLALRPAHSRCHQFHTLIEGFSHFVTSMTAPIASGWSGAGWGSHPLESAAFAPRTPTEDIRPFRRLRSILLYFSLSVPVVFAGVVDPVSAGYVASLARPGGNATGFLLFEYGVSCLHCQSCRAWSWANHSNLMLCCSAPVKVPLQAIQFCPSPAPPQAMRAGAALLFFRVASTRFGASGTSGASGCGVFANAPQAPASLRRASRCCERW